MGDIIELRPKLTKGEQFIVDWQRGILGGFFSSLASTIMRADQENLDNLHKAFPEEVDAYRSYTGVSGWWEALQIKAGISE